MKKLLFALIIGVIHLHLAAQDTLTGLPPCAGDNWPYDYNVEVANMLVYDNYHIKLAKKYNFKSAPIVGIAHFALTPPEDKKPSWDAVHYSWDNKVYDTAFNECFEYFRLYIRHTDTSIHFPAPYVTVCQDTMETIASAKMHVLDTNVIGYFDGGQGRVNRNLSRYIPIRAAYFDSAVTINDEYWIGRTFLTYSNYTDSNGREWEYKTWPICEPAIRADGVNVDGIEYGDTLFLERWWYASGLNGDYSGPFIHRSYYISNLYFPIFPLFCEMPVYPSPIVLDSAGGGTAEVAPVLSASDLVTLSPNPAVTAVTVLSSTGVRQVRVYDITGRMVYESKADGLQATIPVAGWPNGVYTVHVDTPMGLAVKKLEKVE